MPLGWAGPGPETLPRVGVGESDTASIVSTWLALWDVRLVWSRTVKVFDVSAGS